MAKQSRQNLRCLNFRSIQSVGSVWISSARFLDFQFIFNSTTWNSWIFKFTSTEMKKEPQSIHSCSHKDFLLCCIILHRSGSVTLCSHGISSFPAASRSSVMNANVKRLQTMILLTKASALDSAFLQSCFSSSEDEDVECERDATTRTNLDSRVRFVWQKHASQIWGELRRRWGSHR